MTLIAAILLALAMANYYKWYFLYGGIINKVMGQKFLRLDNNQMGNWFKKHKRVYYTLFYGLPITFIVLLIIEL